MRRITMSVLVALLALATALVGTAAAKKPPKPQTTTAKKVNICHFTGKKFVAITVSRRAMQTHVQHHQDIIDTSVVPQGTTRQRKVAARTFCAQQQVLTPTSGGNVSTPTLTSTNTAVNATIDLRTRLGQGQLCLMVTVNTTPSTAITLSSIKILSGTNATVATLDLSSLGSLSSTSSPLTVSGCVNVTRSLVKQIIRTTGLKVQITTSSPAATLTGSL